MIPVKEIHENLRRYGIKDHQDVKIGTICSHSALQIFAGAKQEGIKTVGICKPERLETYRAFPHATPDKFIEIQDFKDILKPEFQDKLLEEKVIMIPHGSFVEYVGPKNIEDNSYVPTLGNRAVLQWESDREKQREWLEKHAGLNMPKRFHPHEIDGLCLIKFSGAKGGRGFFKVTTPKEFHHELKRKIRSGEVKEEDVDGITIQEFIIGTRYYFHYFYSPLHGRGFKAGEGTIELTGIDRRDETNADELQRLVEITDEKLSELGVKPSYVVVGNRPLVLRESLLPKMLEMGRKVVDASIRLFPPGIIGPFCLEAICTPDLNFTTFEISARIVAGTNLYITGSPYSYLTHGVEMSTGRRIALEIKNAIKKNQLEKIIY